MASLYRYINEKHMDSTLAGKVLFRALTYYRDLENDGIRGDRFEGSRIHRPEEGLLITNVKTGEQIKLGNEHFISSAHEEYIYVSCMSTELSKELFEKFESNVCIEILDGVRYFQRIQKAIRKFLGDKVSKQAKSENVNYYSFQDPLKENWALPERIAFSKPKEFEWQKEFRIAYPTNDAFDFENVKIQIKQIEKHNEFKNKSHGQRFIDIGNIERLCNVHRV